MLQEEIFFINKLLESGNKDEKLKYLIWNKQKNGIKGRLLIKLNSAFFLSNGLGKPQKKVLLLMAGPSSMTIKPEGGGGGGMALMARPLREDFFIILIK